MLNKGICMVEEQELFPYIITRLHTIYHVSLNKSKELIDTHLINKDMIKESIQIPLICLLLEIYKKNELKYKYNKLYLKLKKNEMNYFYLQMNKYDESENDSRRIEESYNDHYKDKYLTTIHKNITFNNVNIKLERTMNLYINRQKI
ncbi:hypothetical protein PBILCG01_1131500 [Plasmodium sp. DRC-Itaito]|nr:hypothetical protein PBILCG01_1131500 [Plasmodium sp. DRC-Itaito]